MINSATYWNKEIDKGYEYKNDKIYPLQNAGSWVSASYDPGNRSGIISGNEWYCISDTCGDIIVTVFSGRYCNRCTCMDFMGFVWRNAFYDIRLYTKLHGCVFWDGFRIHNDRFQYFKRCRSASAVSVVLAESDSLDRRNGSAGVCTGAYIIR